MHEVHILFKRLKLTDGTRAPYERIVAVYADAAAVQERAERERAQYANVNTPQDGYIVEFAIETHFVNQ